MPMECTWKDETPKILDMMNKGVSLEAIGASYGVSKQRIYQILRKYGIDTPFRKRTTFLTGKPPKYFWLDKMLTSKGFKGAEKNDLLNSLNLPDYCPVFGVELNYHGLERHVNSRSDASPSIDRIDSSKDYTADNIQVLSWRANRIKNDATPKELELLANYMREVEHRS